MQLWLKSNAGDLAGVNAILSQAQPQVINMPDQYGATALLYATRAGKTDIVKRLLAEPVIDVNVKEKTGNNALAIAVRSGNIDIVKLLLANDKLLINAPVSNNQSVLQMAEKSFSPNKAEIIELLKKRGASLQPEIIQQQTEELPEIFKQPIEKAEISALPSALPSDLGKQLSEQASLPTELQQALAQATSIDAAAKILENEKIRDLLKSDAVQNTIITDLAKRFTDWNKLDVVLMLLTPWAAAWLKNRLVDENDPKSQLPNVFTIQKLSFQFVPDLTQGKNLPFVKFIVRYFPELVNTPGRAGLTPLMSAAQLGSPVFDWILDEKGVDINKTNKDNGYSALAYAIVSGNLDIVKKLLKAGADVTIKVLSEETARRDLSLLDLARSSGVNTEGIVKALQEYGAK
jgi:ankyrin repeat protein